MATAVSDLPSGQYYRDLNDYIAALDKAGKLQRVTRPIDKDTQMHPLVRLQFRGLEEKDRKAWLFENITDAKGHQYDMPLVLCAMAGSSDIYALGLVLYELYTGKKAFEAATLAELKRVHAEQNPAPPSSLTVDIDPVVERAILRCLEKEPAKRPASAVQLAASLPGGDPLAAAIAAGETPSPEMVAAAGEEGALAPAKAWALFLSVLALLGVILWLNSVATMVALVKPQKSPELLTARASELLQKLGHADKPADSDGFFFQDFTHQQWRTGKMKPTEAVRGLDTLDPSLLLFYYRQSPRPLTTLAASGVVNAADPPNNTPGMIGVVLDPQGRLQFLRVQSPSLDRPPAEGSAPPPAGVDWPAVFAEAGLDFSKFQPVESQWNPQVPYDARLAWEGSYGSYPSEKFHVTGAAYRGKPVWFSVVSPWTPVPGQTPATQPAARAILIVLNMVIVFGLMIGCAVFARRNVAAGRGDRKGAFRIMVFVMVVGVLDWLTGTHYSGDANVTFTRFMDNTADAVFRGVFLYMIYLALEPLIRRRTPHLLISWSRLLAGRVRDPLVGRDALLGIACGAALATILRAMAALPWWFDLSGSAPIAVSRAALAGLSDTFSGLCSIASRSTLNSLAMLGVFFLLLVLLRKKWAAATVLGVVMAFLFASESANAGLLIVIGVTMGTVLALSLLRFGQLTFLFTWFTMMLLNSLALPLDLSRWYAPHLLLSLAPLLLAACFAFYSSLGGKPLLGKALEDA